MSKAIADCPFQWGDRVDHRKFGIGRIIDDPSPSGRPVLKQGNTVFCGWSATIEWEDSAREPARMALDFVLLVERVDAKGGAYWANEHTKLLAPAITKLRSLESALQSSFRPQNSGATAQIPELLYELEGAVAELLEFIRADDNGEHR